MHMFKYTHLCVCSVLTQFETTDSIFNMHIIQPLYFEDYILKTYCVNLINI